MKGSAVPAFDVHSREYLACNAFAKAVWQRTYAAGLLRCFDLPHRVAGNVQYTGSTRAYAKYVSRCQSASDEKDDLNDDPWMLRQLAREVQALLLERWDVQQVRCMLRDARALLSPFNAHPELVRGLAAPEQQADYAG